MWDLHHILEIARDALQAEAARLDLEQSHLGIDALDELAIHPLLHQGLRCAGFGVHSEQRYPGDAAKPNRTEGDRCDIVLTHEPAEAIRDPLLSGTLFEGAGVDPGEALWIEVKVVGQFTMTDGAVRANPTYSSQLLQLVPKDIRKLARDPLIAHAAALVVVFTSDEATAQHDLRIWAERAISKSVPCSMPIMRSFAITDHMGNGNCTMAIMQTHHL